MYLKSHVIIVDIEHSVERMDKLKPTKEQFEDYVAIRNSGVTNMFNVTNVCNWSNKTLTPDVCLYIMGHFQELAQEYQVQV